MYNLNVSLAPTPYLNGMDGGMCGTTPRTPEILNSLIAMTNPMDSYPVNPQVSQHDSHSSCSGSPLDSPASTATMSVQQTCSQLIKAGLKLSIQSKRKLSSGDSSCGDELIKMSRKEIEPDSSDEDDDDYDYKSPKTGLTPEDEDRRRRRRERNKIAATKCRMKKREKTQNLVSESEVLENQNINLKNEVRALENQRRKLVELLEGHGPTCMRQGGYQTINLPSPACKFFYELGFCDQNGAEIKYSQTLKSQNNNRKGAILPHGYCKQSPTTDAVYAMSPDSGFIKSPTDVTLASFPQIKNDYIPNCEIENNNGGVGGTNGTTDFMLKSEIIDSNSPYTTVQSADRFLFENSENYESESPTIERLGHSHNIKENNRQQLEFNQNLQNSFDGNIIKNDFLNQSNDFLNNLVEVSEAQFTDLDSGITSYNNNTNGGCLV